MVESSVAKASVQARSRIVVERKAASSAMTSRPSLTLAAGVIRASSSATEAATVGIWLLRFGAGGLDRDSTWTSIPAAFGPAADEVDQHVLAQGLGLGEERPATVEPGDVGHELGQRPGALEHERVDRDPGLRAALDLAQGRL